MRQQPPKRFPWVLYPVLPRGDCRPIQNRHFCIIAPRLMNRLPAARHTRSEIVTMQIAALQSKPRHSPGSYWEASARGSPDYSSSRRCNRLVTSQAAGAASGTASRISQTVTSRGQENPLKRPAESPLSCHRRGRRMLANLYRQATGGCQQKRPRLSRNKHQQFRRCVPRNPREAITPFAFDESRASPHPTCRRSARSKQPLPPPKGK